MKRSPPYVVLANMDIRQLEMFAAVAEEKSFTAAAERLHVSQSAVSRQLMLLEEELGTKLFHRHGRGATLTDPGQILLDAAHRISREMQDVASQITETQTLQRGALRIGGGMTVCLFILPKLLRRFRAQYKQVDLHVTTGSTDHILRLLRQRDIEIALLTLPLNEADLTIQPVLREEMVLMTPPRHPLTRKRSVDARAVARHPLILFESGSNTRKVVDDRFASEGVPMKVIMETENVDIIKSMVAAGLGVTIVPYGAIAHDIRAGRFAWARIRGTRLYRDTGWVYLKSDYLPRGVSEILRIFDSMKDQFGGSPR